MKRIKNLIRDNLLIFISIFISLVFHFNFFFNNAYIIDNNSQSTADYPSIFFLKSILEQGIFPFYTDKLFSGYPIYLNSQFSYLNPLRIIFSYLLPFDKVFPFEYFIFSTIGIIGYFLFLREKKISDSAIFFSHVIFFYSPQFLSRFFDQSFLYISFLIPLFLYFTENIFEEISQKKKKIALLLSSLVLILGFLYGSFSGIFLLITTQIIYISCIRKYLNYSNLFKILSLLFLIVFSFSFYSLLPSLTNIQESNLKIWNIVFSKFTLSSFGIIELYLKTYQGLCALIICCLGFFYLKKIEFKKYFAVVFFAYLFLVIFKYEFLSITFGVILSFSLSLLFCSIVDNLIHGYERNSFFEMLKNLLLIVSIFLVILFLFVTSINFNKSLMLNSLNNFLNLNIVPNIWISFLTTVSLIILISIYKITHRKYLLIFLPIISVLEIVTFSNFIYTNNLAFKSLIDKDVARITNFYSGKRVAFDNNIIKNEGLYYKSWGVYGDTFYTPKEYSEYLNKQGLNSKGFQEKNYFLLDELKVYRVIDENYNIHGVSDGQIFSTDYETISLNDNHKIFKIEIDSDQTINSFIKFNKNIEVLVNNQKIEFPKIRGIFYEIDLNKGNNTIEFIYQPRELYLGAVFGIILSLISIIILKKSEI